jgi:uncharacterized membrane protein (DUF4010 family)
VNFDLGGFAGVIVAILGGAAVGVERQHSGHATGPDARLGGIRTFTLLGTIAGIAGMLIESEQVVPATLLIAGGLALIVAGYVRASKKDIDATTEVSAALTTLTVLLLAEKPRIHGFVKRLDEPTMLAAARFAVMSVVILPLLPEGPYGPGPGFKPRELWMLVLLFSGMSFVGFILHRLSGNAGYPLTGLIGGLVSSTSVTLTFARLSKTHREQHSQLATGVAAASTILFLRVAVAVAILNAALLPTLARYLVAPFVVGLVAVGLAWRSLRGSKSEAPQMKNPLQLKNAIELAALFQVVLYAVFYVRQWVGDAGLLAGGFILGLTDVDALTMSMTRSVSTGTSIESACRAILMGIIANSIMKAVLSFGIGKGRFRVQAGLAMLAMAAAGAAALFVM